MRNHRCGTAARFLRRPAIRHAFLLALLGSGASMAATPDWTELLRRQAVEQVKISPDGRHLALAQRQSDGTVITIRDADTLAVVTVVDPGARGEVGTLRWLDDDRLLLAANRADNKYQVAFFNPALYIVSRDGKSRTMLPGNFVATIEGDPEHLLVSDCTDWHGDHCTDEVRRVEIGHTTRKGERVIAAPDGEAELIPDRHGAVRFAVSANDEGDSKLHVHRGAEAGWTLVNDSSVTGLHVMSYGMDSDGLHAWLVAERKDGVSAIERFDMATGAREEVYRHPTSDPVMAIRAFDGETPVGAYYDPTHPRAVLWNARHPDLPALQKILAAFPGQFVRISSATRDRSRSVVETFGDRNPGSFYLFDRDTNRATLLTTARPWLDAATLPASREVVLKARDGLQLHGLLTLPPGVEARDLPMVVVAHGGPYEVYDTAEFDEESSLLARRGYAVLRVNFRGSGGYGREFSTSGYMQWGRAMQDDLTDATRWAIAQGIADASRVCLYGASYGGYAALMGAIREPHLYRCVAGYAAPYDLAKMYKWGSIRRTDLGMNYLARVIGKDPVELAARSPAKNAAAIKVPVFLAHGRADARVDIAHSRAMAKALRKAGVEVEVAEYPEEGHGLRIEADKLDFYARLLAFLDKHIGPKQPGVARTD